MPVATREQTETDYDVIVAEAGPGGSALATLLAKAGLRALLVDKNRAPERRVAHRRAVLRGLRRRRFWPRRAPGIGFSGQYLAVGPGLSSGARPGLSEAWSIRKRRRRF